jgi:hypothetical protein
MKEKTRALLIVSWLVLRLRWSLIFLQQSFTLGGIQRGGTKPGIIFFTRQHRQFPLARWNFETSHGAYLYADQTEKAISVCFLPESSRN